VAELTTPSHTLIGQRRRAASPPSELTDAQAAVWRETVAAYPHGWFEGASSILVAYTKHVCRARLLELQVRGFETEWLKVDGGLERLDKLLAMAERETRAMLACARSLRITPQSLMRPETAGRRMASTPRAGHKFPWD
jgi:hypothetical protein